MPISRKTDPKQSAKSSSPSAASSSDESDHSKSTVPTVYSHRPWMKKHEPSGPFYTGDVRDSISTYASTVPSFEDLPDEPRYEVVTDRHEIFPSNTIPSNPSTFADLFPSARRLLIRHDDSTIDGNMNLRVDTLVLQDDRIQQEVTLYHLRMHDLHTRKFSFRRYCRESGREVCHSVRKFNQPAMAKRSGLRRSWSSVLSNLRPGSSGNSSAAANLKRQDSGYKSGTDEDAIFDDDSTAGSERSMTPTNTILLEFSNYAHVDLKRGPGPLKRYEFEYWSTKYQWRRVSRKDGDSKEISYHLVNMDTSKTVAHIVPEVLTPMEMVEEESKGGWVPQCSMWISDPSIYEKMHDVADVVVATGLVALVDDSIKRRWHSKRHVLLNLPKNPFTRNVDAVGPKKLIDEMFHRRGSASSRQEALLP
ncbi:hypothetical protein VTN77DRAFT_9334 [Rasamsonia byssochlamydoides]|uniref:uncharacterized protein n=1 Tax=Rasamsonia byssochlamydoides TaxID=89139 RepID=UPI003743CF6E